MIRHILRLETDAGRNLSRLKNIVAIEVENGFVLGEAVAQGNIHIARRRQVVDALNGFTMHKSGHRQLQVGFGGESKSIVHLGNAIALLSVERNIPEITILFAMPQADEGKTRIQPILHLKRYRGLYTCLLLIIKIECLVDFNQTFGRLVERLYGVVLGMVEPSAEDVFALQNIGHFKLILLRRFQQRITMQLRVSATDVRDGILHRPVVGIVLVAAQRELKDMSR